MKTVYVSTDDFEAEGLIDPNSDKNYPFNEIDVVSGEYLRERIGFNPMCSINFDDKISDRELQSIIKALVKEGLFVALDGNGRTETYVPKDIDARNELVKIAMRRENSFIPGWGGTSGSSFALIQYSNNTSEIREFEC